MPPFDRPLRGNVSLLIGLICKTDHEIAKIMIYRGADNQMTSNGDSIPYHLPTEKGRDR